MTAVDRGMHAHKPMMRAAILTGCLIGMVGCEQRSSSTIIEAEGAQIVFSVRWGWGMVQSVGFAQDGRVASQQEEDVWKKPYNAGGPVYSDGTGSIFYISLFKGLYRVDLSGKKVENVCQIPENFASSLKYIGQLSLREMHASNRGEGVVFSPVGTTPPVRSGVSPGLASLTSGRCG